MTDRDKQKAAIERYKLDEIDKQILKLKLEHPRITDQEIGDIVGLARQNVNGRRNKPAFKAAVTEYLRPASDHIKSLVSKAARKYGRLLDSQNEAILEKSAKTILISEGILKDRLDVDATIHEPLIITRPMAKEVIEISTQKKLPGEKE